MLLKVSNSSSTDIFFDSDFFEGDDGDVHSDESGSGSRAVLRRRRGFRINDDDVDDDEIN